MIVESWIRIRIKVFCLTISNHVSVSDLYIPRIGLPIKKAEALEAHFEALEGQNLGKSKW
jgi:hypothetical protein